MELRKPAREPVTFTLCPRLKVEQWTVLVSVVLSGRVMVMMKVESLEPC